MINVALRAHWSVLILTKDSVYTAGASLAATFQQRCRWRFERNATQMPAMDRGGSRCNNDNDNDNNNDDDNE